MAEKETRAYVSMADFARIVNSSNSIGEVAERTGLKESTIRTKIVQTNKVLASQGAALLKRFSGSGQRGRAKTDPAAVVAAAAEGLEVANG